MLTTASVGVSCWPTTTFAKPVSKSSQGHLQPLTRGELSQAFGIEVSRGRIARLRAADLIASGPRTMAGVGRKPPLERPVVQHKAGHPVQFDITEQTREALGAPDHAHAL